MSTKKLYTFLVDYASGFHVSQYYGTDGVEATKEWAKTLDLEEMEDLSEKNRAELIEEINYELDNYPLFPEENLENVFCLAPTVAGDMWMIHVVRTVTSGEKSPSEELSTSTHSTGNKAV